MFLKKNRVCFKGGQCLIPFVGLGGHIDRTRAGHGVEELSADSVLSCFTWASIVFPFLLLFFSGFFGTRDLQWLHDTTQTGSLFKTPCADEHIWQYFSSEVPLSCAARWQEGVHRETLPLALLLPDLQPTAPGLASLFSPSPPQSKGLIHVIFSN